ncbi:hypothetical protein OG802_18625 [Streptomyces sp. NBC_00704]|uniref:SCO2400 family protein n=1 Tax=Streptomyces sp. NBC_00704 TaxID=2975809 RepID=UPI002E37127C|nr:hypothetical protein [Streptomyces sp. NBC_00704]
MDYCSSCRRHLNGALVCPGCGAYAPDIAPVTTHDRVVPARIAQPMHPTYTTTYAEPAPWAEPSHGPAPAAPHGDHPRARPSGPSPDRPAPASSVPSVSFVPSVSSVSRASSEPEPVPAVEPAPAAPRGRAARRRQLARWKKHQRRAVVATAVALVGGGLTVAAMDRQGGDRTQAAAAPELPSSSGGEVPTSDHTRPTVTRSDAHRPAPADVASQSPSTELGGERYTPSDPRPDTAAGSGTRTTTRSAQGRGTGSSYGGAVTAPGGSAGRHSSTPAGSSGSAGSAANGGTGGSDAASTPNSAAGPATGSGSTSGSASGATSGSPSGSGTSPSSTNTAPAATSPSQVCLLGLLCLS